MAKIQPPERDGTSSRVLRFMGQLIDLDDLPQGELAPYSDMAQQNVTHFERAGAYEDVSGIWKTWTSGASAGPGRFARWERLEGKYSATHWLRAHPILKREYLRKRFDPREIAGRDLELTNTPTKYRHLIQDGTTNPAKKLEKVTTTIGRAESMLITVTGGRGIGHKSTGVGTLAEITHREHGRSVAYLDTRPKDLLPPFARRIVDLREADQEELVVIEESSREFGNRESMGRVSRMLPALLAVARHRELTGLAITPSSDTTDVIWDKLSDGQIIKPVSMNQRSYARVGEARIYREFAEMVPSARTPEWGVFVANKVAPTTFAVPYVRCPPHKHDHGPLCAVSTWWTREMSFSQLQRERSIQDDDVVDLAVSLLYWDRNLFDIQRTMERGGARQPPEVWASMLIALTNGIHPATGHRFMFNRDGDVVFAGIADGATEPEARAARSKQRDERRRERDRLAKLERDFAHAEMAPDSVLDAGEG